MGNGDVNVGGTMSPCDGLASTNQGGVEILLVTACYTCRNWDKFQPDWPLGLCADFNFFCLNTPGFFYM